MQSDFPKSAQFAALTKTGKICAFYKWQTVKYNNGTEEKHLFYVSDFNTWQRSTCNSLEQLIKENVFGLVEIN